MTAPRLFEFPMAGLVPISNQSANELLVAWGHKLGPCNRPFRTESYAFEVDSTPVAIAMTCSIVHGPVAGYQVNEVVELARLASCNGWANRIMLRLWRELCAPRYACWQPKAAISYSHNGFHTGDVYRFDGWKKVKENAGSTGKGGNWKRRGKGYANEVIHGMKTLWIYEYSQGDR
jgi:hypothetical protein